MNPNNLNFVCPCGTNINMKYAAHAENHVTTCQYFLKKYNHAINLIKEIIQYHFLMPRDFMLLVFLVNIYSKGKDKMIFSSYMDYSHQNSSKEKSQYTVNPGNSMNSFAQGMGVKRNLTGFGMMSLDKLKAKEVESDLLSKGKSRRNVMIGFDKQYPSSFQSSHKNNLVMPGPNNGKGFTKKKAAPVIYPSVFIPEEELNKEMKKKSKVNRNNLTFGDEEEMDDEEWRKVKSSIDDAHSTPFDSNKSLKSLVPNIFKTRMVENEDTPKGKKNKSLNMSHKITPFDSNKSLKPLKINIFKPEEGSNEKGADIDILISQSINMCRKDNPSFINETKISAHFKTHDALDNSIEVIQQEYENTQSEIEAVYESLANLKPPSTPQRKTTGLICEHYNLKINCGICCQTNSQKFSHDCFYCNKELSPTVSNILNSVENKIYKTWCGHSFHSNCIENCMIKAWKPSKKLSFDFMDCPICGKDLDLTEDSLAGNLYKQFKKIKNQVLLACLKRMKTERIVNCKALTNKKSIFYKKPRMLAMACYVSYECTACRMPYIAGRIQPKNEGRNREKEMKLISPGDGESLICPNCSIFEGCKVHSLDYSRFKCRYCCKKATWFCFGTAHFCSGCFIKYKRNNDWVKRSENWKRCERVEGEGGKIVCKELAVFHKENPAEMMLECVACEERKGE